MSYSVCITYLKDVDDCCLHWDHILRSYPIDKVFVLGNEPWGTHPTRNATHIITLDEIPKEHRIVCLAPQTGRTIKGEVSLYDYTHKDNSVYVFGPDIMRINEDMIGSASFDRVYIPCEKDEFYSWVAAAITFYDIGVKQWVQ